MRGPREGQRDTKNHRHKEMVVSDVCVERKTIGDKEDKEDNKVGLPYDFISGRTLGHF